MITPKIESGVVRAGWVVVHMRNNRVQNHANIIIAMPIVTHHIACHIRAQLNQALLKTSAMPTSMVNVQIRAMTRQQICPLHEAHAKH